jgi:manganese transport protein
MKFLKNLKKAHAPRSGALDFLKYIGPGLLVTIGFIDPGNWASNIAAGSQYGYTLLWVVTLSTIMLIILQHNAAHLGIATGLCLAEAATIHLRPAVSRSILITAVFAAVSTLLAEILGGAIALQILFKVPLKLGALMIAALVGFMLYTNSYKRIEKWIIGFVSLIGLSFIYELTLVPIDWAVTGGGVFVPAIPAGSLPIIMSVLGAVVMPHNLFLHSEIIQSRQWNLQDESTIKKQMDYEPLDTIFSMVVGWAINSAMIMLAAATFFKQHIPVAELPQAAEMLKPLVGTMASVVFALALLFAGVASSITAGIGAGTISSGFFGEHYNIKDSHTRLGVGLTMAAAVAVIFFIQNPFQGLVLSQIILSMQLPFTIYLQIRLTSSKKVMGKYANSRTFLITLCAIGAIVVALNLLLLGSLL